MYEDSPTWINKAEPWSERAADASIASQFSSVIQRRWHAEKRLLEHILSYEAEAAAQIFQDAMMSRGKQLRQQYRASRDFVRVPRENF